MIWEFVVASHLMRWKSFYLRHIYIKLHRASRCSRALEKTPLGFQGLPQIKNLKGRKKKKGGLEKVVDGGRRAQEGVLG